MAPGLGLAPEVKFDPAWLFDDQKKVAEAAFAEAKQESAKHMMSAMVDRAAYNEMVEDINDYVWQGYYGLTAIGTPIPKRSHSGAFGFVDTDRKPLNGPSKYTITFKLDDMPPLSEFWELPIYDEGGYFVDNETDRYSINSFMLDRGDLHTADALNPLTAAEHLPESNDPVLVEYCLVGNDREVCGLGLCDQHTIEWISMRPRKVSRALSMFDSDVEPGESLAHEVLAEFLSNEFGALQLTQPHLCRDFPR
jgi:hypothetical protein